MKKTLGLLALFGLLTACNTFEGVGKDVKNAGETITDSASKVKQKINEK